MYTTIPQMFETIATTYPSFSAQMVKDKQGIFQSIPYSQVFADVDALAASLSRRGIKRGDLVGLVSDNRSEWLVTDLAILTLGAADVPRGRDAMPYEISFILSTTEAAYCFVENAVQLRKILNLKEKLPLLKHLIVMDKEFIFESLENTAVPAGVEVLLFSDLLSEGRLLLNDSAQKRHIAEERKKGRGDEVATVIFTSGTTGDPKGVVLTHENFAFQLEELPKIITRFAPGQRWLSVLPVWHSFERILQYTIVSQASAIAYSKPLGSILLADLQAVNPHWMGSVPRIWEAVKAGVFGSMKNKSPVSQKLFKFFVSVANLYDTNKDLLVGDVPSFKKRNRFIDVLRSFLPTVLLFPLYKLGDHLVYAKVKEKLGKNFLAGVSGGGSLSESVDRFFSSIGIKLLDGYGLTESSPVIAVRYFDHSIKRTVSPLGNTEVKIVDENGNSVAPGVKGLLMVRGKQVMKGYYKRPDLTAKVLSPDGWLNTGDLGIWTHDGQFSIAGRAKDTIVLSGGENLEPVPIEAKLCECEMIEQAVVVGQDMKYLGALVVLNKKLVEEYLTEQHIPYLSDSLSKMKEVNELIAERINEIINSKHGFKNFEHILRFAIITKPFEIGKELSAKQELKRFEINRIYKNEIDQLFVS
ncbi:AMP-forming long-chain acyl-CoA synthetase [Sphaerochaeta pleomorpha str. Grapes]|uniref:AMP-forming long-chain acyl-CoA synthetase n=1 Tax=Sphaerochaeta pleomorpha (strain ATCC BAA-1885 / DSM 22778 / Grapes) TaxID=158190 RepID=G8QR68_SPHPG|nr:AMP-binding protein [Sphaerochaeta pleomorpha]AEV31003.1 AMP-forming long-chain acyl-CoA synthetase [Sphaerochaeta pleomorpha str. Grapes]